MSGHLIPFILRVAFDWLFICVDPSDVRDLRVKVVVEIETP